MKKWITQLWVGIATVSFLTVNSHAVWPPETMLQQEANKASSPNTVKVSEPALPRPRALVDKLEEDERQLEKALRDLQNDTNELKHDGDHTVEPKTPIKY